MIDARLVGAEFLGADGLHDEALGISGGVITGQAAGRDVDLTGYLVLPGIVDVHGDGFERHVAPRRGAMKQVSEGLIAVEAELAANGITTGVLAQFISWEGGLRGGSFAAQVFDGLKQIRDRVVTDMRGQVRFETHQLDLYDTLTERLKDWAVTYLVFNDHLPHDRLLRGQKPRSLVAQALRAGRSPEAHEELIAALHANGPEVPAALDWLCEQLKGHDIHLGSHDDHTAEGRDIWAKRGVQIAEFPETQAAAEAAKASGGHVILGAPNVVRGGSHKGNASALDLVIMGLCDALASDYHYPSLRRAAIMLWQSGALDLPAAWALVSSGPARILGLTDRGSLDEGMRADLVILERGTMRVAATLAGGRISYMSGDIAGRFIP